MLRSEIGGLLGGDIGAQKFLQLSDRKRLLEMTDDGEAERLSQLFGGLDDADVDAAHQDDARLAVSLAQQPQDFDSIHLRHDQVKQDKGGVRADALEKLLRMSALRRIANPSP